MSHWLFLLRKTPPGLVDLKHQGKEYTISPADSTSSNDHTQSGPVVREFLGLHQPPLVSATDWLVSKFRDGNRLNLLDQVIVLPTRRSQIRILQLLVAAADKEDLFFTPPTITSVGQLPELLYSQQKDLANDLAQQIAWSKALEETPDEEIKSLTGRENIESLTDWQPLAKVLSSLHRRLANDVWSFVSVAREVRKVSGFLDSEQERWDVLEKIQGRYYEQLKSVELWDRQAARNVSIHRRECRAKKNIIMLGAADLNRSVRLMLAQVAPVVSVLVAADESMADRFDEFGSLITSKWKDQTVDIADEKIRIVDQPADQSHAAVQFVTELATRIELAADQVTIGVPDKVIVPQIERSLNGVGLAHRRLDGRSLAETSPVRMMIACRDYLEKQDYDSLAALVRHPDLFQLLATAVESQSWLGHLDEFQNDRLPAMIRIADDKPFGDPSKIAKRFDADDDQSKKRAERKARTAKQLNAVHAEVKSLLQPLAGDDQPIANWTRPWSDVLVRVYGHQTMNKNDARDRQIIKACDAIYSALGDHQQVPAGWQTEMSAAEALEMAIQAATDSRVVDPPIPDAVELAGWLDLPLDDAPVLVVTGMNDDSVPASEVGHQFLPNSLCEKLEIEDNDRRYARDVYALTVINAVRDNLLLITGRRDEKGEPKKPSRLLFTTDHTSAARRARAYFSYSGKSGSQFWLVDPAHARKHDSQQFVVPLPICTKPLDGLPVTQFKEFLKCPYRFYLGKVLRLKSITDDWRELNGGLFGDLCHNVLEAFGRHDIRRSERPGEIREFLCDQLDTQVKQLYSGSRLPAVKIQVEQLRLRLGQFSELQAQYRRQGWLIVSTEEMLYHDLDVDGSPFTVRGKIDRVDMNEINGHVAVWDYKSSDAGAKPEAAHYMARKKEWKDLQLPLYRYLVREVSAVAGQDLSQVGLGYVLLPKKLDEVGFAAAEWDEEILKTADEAVFDVIRKVRAGNFWPPEKFPPLFSEEFAAICQDNVFEKAEFEQSLHGNRGDGPAPIPEGAPF